ncbi:MAG: hypothetical protein ACREA0_06920, partial [bacterium]
MRRQRVVADDLLRGVEQDVRASGSCGVGIGRVPAKPVVKLGVARAEPNQPVIRTEALAEEKRRSRLP